MSRCIALAMSCHRELALACLAVVQLKEIAGSRAGGCP